MYGRCRAIAHTVLYSIKTITLMGCPHFSQKQTCVCVWCFCVCVCVCVCVWCVCTWLLSDLAQWQVKVSSLKCLINSTMEIVSVQPIQQWVRLSKCNFCNICKFKMSHIFLCYLVFLCKYLRYVLLIVLK